MDEKTLYESLVGGDEKALALLYDRYFAVLSVYANRFLYREDSCVDIVHESFIKVWERRRSFTSLHSIISFLYTCVRNACLNELRHIDVKNRVLLQQPLVLDIEDEIIENEVKRIVWLGITKLEGDYRKIVSMSLKGYSVKEISEELKLSMQTIKNKKGRAFKQFYKYMGRYRWCLRCSIFLIYCSLWS